MQLQSNKPIKTLLNFKSQNTTRLVSGFTLVELLVSIGLIGLILGVGVTNYRQYSRRQALLSAAKTVEANLRLAQEYANSGKKPVSGCTHLDGHRFTVSSASFSITAVCDGASVSIGKDNLPLPPDVTMSAKVVPGNQGVGFVTFKILAQGTDLAANTSVLVTLVGAGSTQNAEVQITSGGDIVARFASTGSE